MANLICRLMGGHGVRCVHEQVDENLTEARLARDRRRGALDVTHDPHALRELVREGRSVRYLVPDAVFAYIEKRGLYR